MTEPRLRAYEIGVKGTDWQQIIYHTSPGKAKYEYWCNVTDPWPDVQFKDLTCRVVPIPSHDERLARTAKYRGVPDWKIGDIVSHGDSRGWLTGSDDSANFRVHFFDGKLAGCRLSCHVSELKREADRA